MPRLFLLCLLAFLLSACLEKGLSPGVVARVNGEDIQLRTLQTLLDSRSAAMGVTRRASVEEMHANYVRALAIQIAHTLVRQELASREIPLDKTHSDAFLEELRRDYAPDDIEKFMAAASIPADDWEKLVQDYLAMEIFRNKVLQPGIKIELDEIKHYYNTHQKDFNLPATYSICLASAESRDELAAWCDRGDAAAAQGVLAQCMDVQESALPEGLGNVKKLEAGNCAPMKEEHDEWHAVLLARKNPPVTVSPVEAYALIENILLADKQNEAFEKWLEEKISRSSIQVAPALNEALEKTAAKEDVS